MDEKGFRHCLRQHQPRPHSPYPDDNAACTVSHYLVLRRLDTPFGKFTLVEVKIDTGRTHQIRVHLSSLGHPVVGDSLYGAPKEMPRRTMGARQATGGTLSLSRNFLHAASLALRHPRTDATLAFEAPLPEELQAFLEAVEKSK